MRLKNRYVPLLSLFSFLSVGAFSQKIHSESSAIIVKGIVADSLNSDVLPGAVISLLFKNDTLYTTTDAEGFFSIGTNTLPFRLEASCLGYRIARITANNGLNNQDYGTIRLSRKDYELDAVTVSTRIKMVVYKGDTVLFNAAAFKTLRGATAGDLIGKMPGMTVENGQVKFGGKEVTTAYIDGKLLFGTGTKDALENLEASDVDKVTVYDELSKENKRLGNTDAEKEKVLNITTFSKLIQSTVGHILMSYGADEQKDPGGKRQERYGAGGTFNFFSEKKSLSANLFTNNIDRKTNKIAEIVEFSDRPSGYNTLNVVNIQGSVLLDSLASSVKGEYSYEERYYRNINRTEQIYSPTEDFQSWIYRDTTSSIEKSRIHTMKISGTWSQPKSNLIYNFNTSFNNSDLRNGKQASTTINNQQSGGINGSNSYAMNGLSGSYAINWVSRFSEKFLLKVSNVLTFSKNNTDGLQIDTTDQTSVTYMYQVNNGKDKAFLENMSSSLRFTLKEGLYLSSGLLMSYVKANKKQLAFDNITSRIDSSQTYDYEQNNKSLAPSLDLSYAKGRSLLQLSVMYQYSLLSLDEKMVSSENRRTFNAVLPSMMYVTSWNTVEKGVGSLNFTYKATVQVPSVNMLCANLDNRNPLRLIAGNPQLKQTYSHYLGINYNLMKGETNIVVSGSVNYRQNLIANKIIFFSHEQPLAGYPGYMVPQGASFSTYENIKNAYTTTLWLNYFRPVSFIKSMLQAGLNYSYRYMPMYMNETLIRSFSHAPALSIGLQSSFSRSVEFKFKSQTGYVYTDRSNETKDEALTQRFQTRVDANFFDEHLLCSTFYDAALYRNPDYPAYDLTSHVVNLSVGYQFLKKRNAAVSFIVYDLLNHNKGFFSTIYPNSVSNQWSQMYGRYAMVNFSLRFNVSKSANGKVSNGDYKSVNNESIFDKLF